MIEQIQVKMETKKEKCNGVTNLKGITKNLSISVMSFYVLINVKNNFYEFIFHKDIRFDSYFIKTLF